MTHLSDFSYLQRDVQEIYLTIFLVIRMWQADGFKCLSPARVFDGELRSIVTWFMFFLMMTQATWDYLCTYIKYTEGFMQVAPGRIISKPFDAWSSGNQNSVEVTNYIECIIFSLQVNILLLLQIFWNYLSNTMTRRSFMSSREFSIYILWAIGTTVMFPYLQHHYKRTDYEEVVPQTAYACDVLIVSILGFRNHGRFNRLIRATTRHGKDGHVTDRLTYFRDMNLLLSMALVGFGGSMLILCIDGFTQTKLINSNKFPADLLICNVNLCSAFVWIIIISIFHPARVSMEGKRTDSTEAQNGPRKHIFGNGAKTTIPLASTSSAPYKEPDTDSIQALNQGFNDANTFGHASPSPRNSSALTFGPANHHQRIVSVDDPFAKESITFSMVSPSNTSHASDYYGMNSAPPSVVSKSFVGFRSPPS